MQNADDLPAQVLAPTTVDTELHGKNSDAGFMKVSHGPESQKLRKINFFWEMVSGLCFSIERRAFRRNDLIIGRHSTELNSNSQLQAS